MKYPQSKIFHKGFTFLEIILVLALIAFCFYKLLNVLFKRTLLDQKTQDILAEQGININSSSIITGSRLLTDSVREKIKNIEAQRSKEMENLE